MIKKLKEIYKQFSLIIILLIVNLDVSFGQSFSEDWTVPVITTDSCRVQDMVVDEINGEMYLVGSFTGDLSSSFPTGVNGTFDFSSNYGGRDGFVAKYDLAGNFIWAFYVGGTGEDEVKAIDVSAAGNFYITGNFETIASFNGIIGGGATIFGSFGGIDIFQAAYSGSGFLSWIHEDGSAADDDAIDVKYVQGYNRVIFAGNYYNQGQFGGIGIGVTNNSYHTFVLGRYDNGLTNWLKTSGGLGDELSVELAVKNNDVYLVGEFVQSLSMGYLNITSNNSDDKIFCLKMDAYGNLDWLTSFWATGSLNLEATDINLTSNRIYMTGSYTGVLENNTGIISSSSVGEDCFLLALNENSNALIGVNTFQSGQSFGAVIGKSITQLPNNDAILLGCDFTGSFQPELGLTVSSSSQKDGVIMLLNSQGSHLGNTLITSNDDYDLTNLYLDQNQDLFHSGNWSQTIGLETSSFSATNAVNGSLGKLTINLPCYFDYGQNTFCADTGFVYVDSLSMQSGSFYNLDGNISINSTSGALNIGTSNSTLGSYVYHQNIGCVDSILISVIDRFDASLIVAPYEYCQDDLSIDLASFIVGDTGGYWSGAYVNGSDLNLSNSQSGIFTFQYEAPLGYFCPSLITDSVTIEPAFDPSWLGISSDFCANDPNIVLDDLITGDLGGTFLLGNNSVDTLNFADLPGGINTIRYFGIIGNCPDDSITVFNVLDGEVNAGLDDSICGFICELQGVSSESTSIWTSINGGVTITDDVVLNTSVEVPATGTYSFELYSQSGVCSFKDTVVIEFLEIPILNAGLDQLVNIDEADLIGVGDANIINWSASSSALIGQSNSYITEVSNLVVGNNEFILSGEDEFCLATPDTINVIYQNLTIPNAFSPNGDGYNDTFELIGLETYDLIKLTILTKWGETLLTIDDYQNDWSGQADNTPLADGVYFYMIDYDDNQTQGFIEIKR